MAIYIWVNKCKTLSVQQTFYQSKNIIITKFPVNIVSHSDWQYQIIVNPAFFFASLTDSLSQLPKPMLTYHQRCSMAFTREQFHKNTHEFNLLHVFQTYTFKIATPYPRGKCGPVKINSKVPWKVQKFWTSICFMVLESPLQISWRYMKTRIGTVTCFRTDEQMTGWVMVSMATNGKNS